MGATIAPFLRTHDGRWAILAIVSQHAGRHVWDKIVKEANAVLLTRTWTGTTSITLLQHISGQRKSNIQLIEAAEHAPDDIPNNCQRVTYLLDWLKTEHPKVLACVAAVEQDETGKQVSFKDASTFLLPSFPVAAKNPKNNGINSKVSGTDATTGGGAGVSGAVLRGKTGVELRYHAPKKFAKLSKEQKTEVSVWNRSQLKDGKKQTRVDKTGGSKKAKVAAAKATEVTTAMAESHAVELAAMSAKISSFASGVPQSAGIALPPPPDSAPTFPLAGYGPSQYDLDKKARVASVRLQSILKPPSKKDKKTVP